MRRLALIVLTLSWTLSSYASTPDSRIHITLPTGLSSTVATTLQSEIEKKISKELIAPESISAKSKQVTTSTPTMAIDTMAPIDPTNWEQTIDVTRVYSDTRITSLLITTYEYTGGAHGSTSRTGLVIDNTTGKKLSLADLYNGPKLAMRLSPLWQSQILARLRSLLTTTLTIDEKNWVRDGTRGIDQYQSFVITDKMLIVYGQEYQHNAYAYGAQTLLYPLYRLADLRK